MLAAIFLALASAPKHVIAHDYSMSRIGIEPGREMLTKMMQTWNKDFTADTPGMRDYSLVKAEFMEGTLEMIEEKYGGVEAYVKGLGFEDEDLEKIRRVLKGE